MHHADALADGRDGRMDTRRLPVQPDLAFVRQIEAVENLHQGGFARAVLAEQRVNLAGADVKGDVIAGEHPGKAFDDPGHLQGVDFTVGEGSGVWHGN